MQENIWQVVRAGTLAGVVGTGVGGLFALLPGKISDKVMRALLLFVAGLMTAVVCFDLIPEAMLLGGMSSTMIGVVLGVVCVLLMSLWIPDEGNAMQRTGLLMLIAISVHNLPEGIAIGAGYAALPQLGLQLALVIALHDLPEGIAVAAPLKAAGRNRWMVVLLCALSGLPTGIGAALGGFLGKLSATWVAGCMGFAGGAMLYVTCGEMLPRSHRMEGDAYPGLWQVLGFLVGLVVTRM